jgi:iron complex outermembrane receptor protein
MQKSTLTALRAGVAPFALAVAFAGAPAFAQDTDAPAPVTTVSAEDLEEDDSEDVILVTGTLFSRTDTETPSPVTVLSAETMAERGINTVAEAIQRIPANNAGTIQQGWNTGFNFASGANAPALRGLTVQSTLSIADGLRIAPYPLADDGQRLVRHLAGRRRRRAADRRDLGLRRSQRAGLQLLRQRRIPEAGRAVGARP